MDLLEEVKDAASDDPARRRLEPFVSTAEEHCRLLRAQLRDAQRLADQLQAESCREEVAGQQRVG